MKFGNKINDRYTKVIFPLMLVVISFLIAYYYVQQDKKRLYNNKVFTVGEINDYSRVAKSSATNFSFRFSVDGVDYNIAQVVYGVDIAFGNEFMGKTFPLIYEKGNPSNCELLILPVNFQHINLPYPDSLNWVKKYH